MTTQSAHFREGDAVWIDDGYAGTPHSAVVINVTTDSLWAECTHRPTGDSRVVQWEIAAWKVPEMVSPR